MAKKLTVPPRRIRRSEPEPSNRALFGLAAYKIIGMCIGFPLLVLSFSGRHVPATEVIGVSVILGTVDVALRYRRIEWRRAVSPDHVFGFGIGVLAVLIAALYQPIFETPGVSWARYALFAAVMMLLPGFLIVASARELWRRRVAAPSDGSVP